MVKILIVGIDTSKVIPDIQEAYPEAVILGVDLFPNGVEVFKLKHPDVILYRDSFARIAPLFSKLDLVIMNLNNPTTIEYCRTKFSYASNIIREAEWTSYLNRSLSLV